MTSDALSKRASAWDTADRRGAIWFFILITLVATLLGGILVLDVITPLGVAVWMLYLFPVWLVSTLPERRGSPILPVGIISMGLIVVGFWLSPAGESPWLAAINRFIGLVVLGMTTMLLMKFVAQREAMRRNEEELRDCVESAAIGLHWVRPDGTILWANQAELDLLGYAHNEYIGHSIREFHADAPVVEDILCRLQSGQTLYNYEARLRRKDGAIRHVSIVSNVAWRHGRFHHTRCFTRDITQEKEAQRMQAYLAAIIHSSDDAIIGKTLQGIVTSWNTGAEQLFGYRADEIIGHSVLWLIPRDRHDEEEYILGQIAKGERVTHYKTVRRRKDGTNFHISLTISPVIDTHGRIVGVSTIGRDITEQKLAEESLRLRDQSLIETNEVLRKQAAALAEANKELESFSYSVSHDLRAPLRSIDGFARMLVEDFGPKLEPEASRCLAVIQRGAHRMGELIDDLLEFSRLSRSGMELRSVDPANVIQEVWLELRRHDEDRKVELIVEDLPRCRADRRLLKQVWVNLLSNALKYTGPRQEGRIEIGWYEAAAQPERPVYWIRDNGVGFDQRYVHKLFGVFQRLHRNDEFEGTGVGLAIVHRIVSRHGGRVWAEGCLNHGATFYLTLEKADAAEPSRTHLGLIGRR